IALHSFPTRRSSDLFLQGVTSMAFQKFFFIFWGLCIFPFSNIFSQNDSVKTYKLPDVIVSATKTQISPIEAASSVSVITRNEILDRKSTRLNSSHVK